jgi:hypothetical protein
LTADCSDFTDAFFAGPNLKVAQICNLLYRRIASCRPNRFTKPYS